MNIQCMLYVSTQPMNSRAAEYYELEVKYQRVREASNTVTTPPHTRCRHYRSACTGMVLTLSSPVNVKQISQNIKSEPRQTLATKIDGFMFYLPVPCR